MLDKPGPGSIMPFQEDIIYVWSNLVQILMITIIIWKVI